MPLRVFSSLHEPDLPLQNRLKAQQAMEAIRIHGERGKERTARRAIGTFSQQKKGGWRTILPFPRVSSVRLELELNFKAHAKRGNEASGQAVD
jgi:hypothetical protein